MWIVDSVPFSPDRRDACLVLIRPLSQLLLQLLYLYVAHSTFVNVEFILHYLWIISNGLLKSTSRIITQAWLTRLQLKSLDLLSAPFKAHGAIHQFLKRDVLSNFVDNNLPQPSLFEDGRQSKSRQQDRKQVEQLYLMSDLQLLTERLDFVALL